MSLTDRTRDFSPEDDIGILTTRPQKTEAGLGRLKSLFKKERGRRIAGLLQLSRKDAEGKSREKKRPWGRTL